jgi:3-oxoacyl-(acyl-carrier-protein) synthase
MKRIVITGTAIQTPLADEREALHRALMEGRSAITRWKSFDGIYSKVGGDLNEYPIEARFRALASKVPEAVATRAKRLLKRVPWSTRHSILMSLGAWLETSADAQSLDPEKTAVIVTSTNVGLGYEFQTHRQFEKEPDFIDPMYALHALDTDHAGCVSEVLGLKGGASVVGGACASGNLGLKMAVDEIRYHGMDAVMILAPIFEYSPMYLHGLALMGAISFQGFNDAPERASRPFDRRREGFVPAHGGGALVVESAESAKRRGAQILAEVLAVESGSDASHLPHPSIEGQLAVYRKLFASTPVAPEEIEYVSAHATSTPAGDLAEVASLRTFFGPHAKRLRLNAAKSLLGHPCGASSVVETVVAIEQMLRGELHPTINIDDLDPEVDLEVVRAPERREIRYILKNSFGFGGINCVSLLGRWTDG